MSTWEQKLIDLKGSIPKRIVDTKEIYNKYKPWLNKYKGGTPVGFLAAIIQFESGGKMTSSGDPALGEVGFFQITGSFPPKVGLPAESRYNAETNIFLGCLEYQIMATELFLFNPAITLGSVDSWKLSRLAFAVGFPGTKKIIQNANATRTGRVFEDVKTYINKVGGIPLGQQSTGKVWFRVHAVEVQWEIGSKAVPFQTIGRPAKIPPSPAGLYNLKKEISNLLVEPGGNSLLVTAAVVLALLI